MFDYPWLLLLGLLLPLAIWLRRRGWGAPSALRYPDLTLVRQAFPRRRRPGGGFSEWLRWAAVALLVLAAARPNLSQPDRRLSSSGLDILLALDMSGSMSARDFEPQTRLEAAKTVLREFIGGERRNRLGLVAFAARAYTVCPLTLDYQVLLGLLGHLQVGMTTDGTAIGMALVTALNRLKQSNARSRVIILLTDGRNNAGGVDPLTAAEMAAALKVRVYPIGMGRPEGGSIVITDRVRGESVLKNEDGSVHIEHIDEEVLQKIAGLTGGKYFRATDREKLRAIYREIRTLEKSRLSSKVFTQRQDLGGYLIGAALFLLLAELGLTGWWQRRVPA